MSAVLRERVRGRWGAALPGLVFVVACAVQAGLTFGPAGVLSPVEWASYVGMLGVPVAVGGLLSWRVSANPIGAVLGWVGAAPAAVFTIESWGESVTTAHPWPAAQALYVVKLGAWVWNLAGFVGLCLVFPDGLLPGRRWRMVVWWAVAAGVFLNLAVSFVQPEGGGDPHVPSQVVVWVPIPVLVVIAVLTFGGVLAVLAVATLALVLRYRRGGEVVRDQLRWLMFGAGTVPALLAGGWLAESLGASVDLAYIGFMVAMVVAVPCAVAVAVLRHDLFDVDRLLGATLAWLLTSLLSAAVFAALVYGVADLVGAGTRLGLTGAAFVTAMCLLPVHRVVNDLVGRVIDRERTIVLGRVDEFVRQVRDGEAEPEAAEQLMRSILGDPGLRLLVRPPASPPDAYLDLAGNRAELPGGAACVPLRTGESEVGVIVLSTQSARKLRRAREVALRARLPIEVSRLRLELRTALDDARSSRARLALATAAERQRLARDLHDGAQQQIIAVGMRLRSVQRQLDPARPAHRDLEAAVDALAETVAELRRLAHGVRPSRLEDGLAAALKALVADSPVPVDITVAEVDTSEVVATTAYFVVAEALANALKHANAATIRVVAQHDGSALHVEVSDDGVGGAQPGFGLTSVRDRVTSIGGELTLHSPAGAGTRIQVRL